MFSSKCFMVTDFILFYYYYYYFFFLVTDFKLKSLINFKLILEWCKIEGQLYSFADRYPVFPTGFIEKTIV